MSLNDGVSLVGRRCEFGRECAFERQCDLILGTGVSLGAGYTEWASALFISTISN